MNGWFLGYSMPIWPTTTNLLMVVRRVEVAEVAEIMVTQKAEITVLILFHLRMNMFQMINQSK